MSSNIHPVDFGKPEHCRYEYRLWRDAHSGGYCDVYYRLQTLVEFMERIRPHVKQACDTMRGLPND